MHTLPDRKKPWQLGYDPQKNGGIQVPPSFPGPYRAFFTGLFELSERLGWGITPENVDAKFKADSPFGYMPNYAEFAQRQQGNYTALELERKAAKSAERAFKRAAKKASREMNNTVLDGDSINQTQLTGQF